MVAVLADCCAEICDHPGNVTVEMLEARVRIELTIEVLQTSALPLGYRAICHLKKHPKTKSPCRRRASENWSGRRGLNPRLRPWQGRTLPLSYSRSSAYFTVLVRRMPILPNGRRPLPVLDRFLDQSEECKASFF